MEAAELLEEQQMEREEEDPRVQRRKDKDGKDRTRRNPGKYLPDGTNKQLIAKDPAKLDEFRTRAAVIAVDMERGIFIRTWGPNAGKPWSGSYSRVEIAETLGFNARANKLLPKIFDSPEFERYVEWERIKRDATYRMSMRESMPLVDATVSGMLLEVNRRVLLRPQDIPDHVLFGELRKFIQMKGEYEGAFNVRPDVAAVINNFQININNLPEAARAKALELFQHEIKGLTAGATKIFDAEVRKGS